MGGRLIREQRWEGCWKSSGNGVARVGEMVQWVSCWPWKNETASLDLQNLCKAEHSLQSQHCSSDLEAETGESPETQASYSGVLSTELEEALFK